MCEYIFYIMEIFVFFGMITGFIFVIIARMSILKIKEKLDSNDFLLMFPKSKNCFPNNEYKVMNLNTQITLYKILLFNLDNIQEIVGFLQKRFAFSFFITLASFILFVCCGLFLILIC